MTTPDPADTVEVGRIDAKLVNVDRSSANAPAALTSDAEPPPANASAIGAVCFAVDPFATWVRTDTPVAVTFAPNSAASEITATSTPTAVPAAAAALTPDASATACGVDQPAASTTSGPLIVTAPEPVKIDALVVDTSTFTANAAATPTAAPFTDTDGKAGIDGNDSTLLGSGTKL